MVEAEVMAIMAAIKVAYPNYYKDQSQSDDAITLWSEMLENDDATFIAWAVKKFIQTDPTGFPPSIGQIRSLAKEIRKREWEEKQKEKNLLIAPAPKGEPMPEHLRKKYQNYLKGIEI